MGLISRYLNVDKEIVKRFVGYAFDENPNIRDLSDFREAFFDAFDTEQGDHAVKNIDEQDIIQLFESRECKNLIKNNVSDAEYEKLYGDGNVVKREVAGVTKPKIITITQPRVKRAEYVRKGRKIKGYNATYRKWTTPELKFLQARKQKKISVKNTIAEFNQHFKGKERTTSSIKTKMYRR